MGLVQRVRDVAAALRATAPGRAGIAARTALCVAVPLTVGVVVGQPEAGAGATFGALAGLYVPQSPYRYRGRVVASVGVGLVMCVVFGGLAAGSGILAALVTGAVAGIASFVCQAAALPPPRELMLVMTVLAATDLPAGGPVAVRRIELAAAGALFAWLVTMSPALLGGHRAPERRAVTAAVGAVAEVLDAVGSPAIAAARHGAVTAVQRAQASVSQGALPAEHELARAAASTEALLEAALHVDVEASGSLDPRWADAVRALVPAPADNRIGDVPLPDADSTVGGDVLSRAVEEARSAVRGAPSPTIRRRSIPRWPGLREQLLGAARRHSIVVPAAARLGTAVAVGVGLGRALGLGHAYWVGLTAAAVLQGSNLTVTRSRVLHRVVGTIIGVGLTFALLGWGPPLWAVVVLAAVFQALVELSIATHYGVAVVGITVLALVLFHIGTPSEDVRTALGARLVDTAIGAALALVLRQVLWPRATSARLPQVQSRTVTAIRDVFEAAWMVRGDGALDSTRRRLQGQLAALHAVQADALADTGAGRRASDARWPLSVAVEELAVLALSWPQHRPPPSGEDAHAFLRYLDGLAAAVIDGQLPRVTPPELAEQPRTAAAAATLAVAVDEAHRT
jgi:hypothetical protein